LKPLLRVEISTTVFVPATGWESENRAAWRKTKEVELMRNVLAVGSIFLIASVVAIDAGTPQTTAIMKISGMPG